MAVGDMVSGAVSAPTVLNFQPAAGVEIMLTSLQVYLTPVPATIFQFFDGAITTYCGMTGDVTFNPLNIKCFIDNTRYLRIQNDTNARGYSGIQTK